jgi:nicotinamidase/pyrazinamidase
MIDKDTGALLLIDIQPDFMPGGGLPVEEGDRIVAPVRRLMASDSFVHCVATQDWHPPGHVSFASGHSGCAPMQSIDLYGDRQTLWPEHCVQGSPGAALHDRLPWERVAAIVRKGTDPGVDSYSGFRNKWIRAGERPPTGLTGYLRERGIETVYLCGLARDVCVKYSALDAAADAGFRTFFLWGLTRSVDPSSDDALRRELGEAGVIVIDSDEL